MGPGNKRKLGGGKDVDSPILEVCGALDAAGLAKRAADDCPGVFSDFYGDGQAYGSGNAWHHPSIQARSCSSLLQARAADGGCLDESIPIPGIPEFAIQTDP